MKVVCLHAHGEFYLYDEPEPVLLNGEGLTQFKAVGVCRSASHWFSQGKMRITSSSRNKFEKTDVVHGR